MDGASVVMTIFFNLMGGLGLFFTGVGVLWFVTVYKEKNEQCHKPASTNDREKGVEKMRKIKTGIFITVRELAALTVIVALTFVLEPEILEAEQQRL